MIAFLAIFQLFVGAHVVAVPGKPPKFLGFKIGMPGVKALQVAGKDSHSLNFLPLRGGERVFSDTVSISSCNLFMRRSLGFDSLGKLSAVGLTYKTTPDEVTSARECAFRWLSKSYGPPTSEAIRDNTKQEVWKLEGREEITLEARGYNPHDYFVLIYYYTVPSARPQE